MKGWTLREDETGGCCLGAREVMLLEDDVVTAESLRRGLGVRGFAVRHFPSQAFALSSLAVTPPDIVLLDPLTLSQDGPDMCRAIRSQTPAPILLFAGPEGVAQVMRGMDAGADDYIVKPFTLSNLTMRMAIAIQRRARRTPGHILEAGDLRMDTRRRTAQRGSRELHLSRREFDLLECLVRNSGMCVTKRTLAEHAGLARGPGGQDGLKVHIAYLRRKLDALGEADIIQSRRGIGYVLVF